MSAFLQSGRSDHQILSEIKVRFRPIAVIRIKQEIPRRRGLAQEQVTRAIDFPLCRVLSLTASVSCRVLRQSSRTLPGAK